VLAVRRDELVHVDGESALNAKIHRVRWRGSHPVGEHSVTVMLEAVQVPRESPESRPARRDSARPPRTDGTGNVFIRAPGQRDELL